MLRKLRLKFIALNMAMVAVVVVVVFGLIGTMAYRNSMDEVSRSLDVAVQRVDHRGASLLQDLLEDEGSPTDDGSVIGGKNDGPPTPPEIGGKRGDGRFIPVAVYAVDQYSHFCMVNQATTASISSDVIDSALSQTVGAADGQGLLRDEGLFYLKHTTRYGDTLIAFADQESASEWKSVVGLLVAAGLGTLLIFLIISIFFSRWALRPVEQAWNQQRQFLADASHELKTPLTVIMANAAIATKDPDATIGSQEKWLGGIKVESERMQHMIGDMLTLAKSDAEHDESLSLLAARTGETQREDFVDVDLSTLAESEVLQFESVAFEQSLVLDDHIQEGLTVRGDEAKLGRLTTILLDNACKYADPHTTVTLNLKQEGGKAQLSVQNFGNVISAEDLPHVFDRFFRTDKARTRSESGASSAGLGLAIAAETARAHGGAIAVTSSAEEGTVFTVTLPLAK